MQGDLHVKAQFEKGPLEYLSLCFQAVWAVQAANQRWWTGKVLDMLDTEEDVSQISLKIFTVGEPFAV